jgi:hypothetical protein
MPQVTAVDEQFGTHTVPSTKVSPLATPASSRPNYLTADSARARKMHCHAADRGWTGIASPEMAGGLTGESAWPSLGLVPAMQNATRNNPAMGVT